MSLADDGPELVIRTVSIPTSPAYRAAAAAAAEHDAHRLNSLEPELRELALAVEAEADRRFEDAVLYGENAPPRPAVLDLIERPTRYGAGRGRARRS